MAHNLTQRPNGNYEFAYTGDSPWHSLGQKLATVATKEEMIKAAGLDFVVLPEPIYFDRGDTIMRRVPDYVANIRSDTREVLGVVSKNYRLVQNGEAFQFVDNLVQSAGAKYHTAGSVRGGRQVFASAKLPRTLVVLKDDVLESYLLLVNAHDGSMSLHLRWTDIRVVCDNTLTAAMSGIANYQYSVHHIGDLDGQLVEARKALGIATRYFEESGKVYKAMAAKQIGSLEIERFLTEFLPMTAVGDKATSEAAQAEDQSTLKTRQRIRELVEIGLGTDIPGVKGTVWGMYNAATEWIDRVRTSKKDGTMRANAAEAAVLGVGQDLRNRAMKSALALLS